MTLGFHTVHYGCGSGQCAGYLVRGTGLGWMYLSSALGFQQIECYDRV